MSDEQERSKGAYIIGKKVTYLHYESTPQETFIVYALPEHGCPLCGMVVCICGKEAGADEER